MSDVVGKPVLLTAQDFRRAMRMLEDFDTSPLPCCGLPRPTSPMEVCACFVMRMPNARRCLAAEDLLDQIEEMMPTTMGVLIRLVESKMTPEQIRSSNKHLFG